MRGGSGSEPILSGSTGNPLADSVVGQLCFLFSTVAVSVIGGGSVEETLTHPRENCHTLENNQFSPVIGSCRVNCEQPPGRLCLWTNRGSESNLEWEVEATDRWWKVTGRDWYDKETKRLADVARLL
jgi:hypothetical protein